TVATFFAAMVISKCADRSLGILKESFDYHAPDWLIAMFQSVKEPFEMVLPVIISVAVVQAVLTLRQQAESNRTSVYLGAASHGPALCSCLPPRGTAATYASRRTPTPLPASCAATARPWSPLQASSRTAGLRACSSAASSPAGWLVRPAAACHIAG